MSISVGSSFTNDQGVPIPEQKLTDSDVHNSIGNARSEKTYSHYDEYTTLLKKHLGVVESELSRLKGLQK